MPTHGQPPVLAGRTVSIEERIGCPAADAPVTMTSPPDCEQPRNIDGVFTGVESLALAQKNAFDQVHESSPENPALVSSIGDVTDSRAVTRGSSSPEAQGPSSLETHGSSSPELHTHFNRNRSDEDVFGNPYPITRFHPNSTSSYLKPGFRFTGEQRSETQRYKVTVDIQHVDMEAAFLCGYLKIRGLTDRHPTLTTYFEGEMIGSKYGFITNHEDWGANEKVDLQHWARFPAWRPLQKDARRGNYRLSNWAQRENIWMRWKEHFLVPDHRVKDLGCASFGGFYYICFNQIEGTIQGTYHHAKSHEFQQLDLKPEYKSGFDYGFEFR